MTALRDEEQFMLDADSLPFAVIVFDRAGNALRTNHAWTDLTGQSPQRALTDGWLRAIVASDRLNAAAHIRTVLAGGGPVMTEWRLQPSRHHPQRWARARLELAQGVGGRSMGCLAFIEDSDEEHNRELQLEYQATHDALTGVLNRAEFVDHTRRALS